MLQSHRGMSGHLRSKPLSRLQLFILAAAVSPEAESVFLLSFPKGICVSLRVALSRNFMKTALEDLIPHFPGKFACQAPQDPKKRPTNTYQRSILSLEVGG
jgi:hypothetical protein